MLARHLRSVFTGQAGEVSACMIARMDTETWPATGRVSVAIRVQQSIDATRRMFAGVLRRRMLSARAGDHAPARFTCPTRHDPRSGYFQECPVIALTFGSHPVRTRGQFPR